jgi:ribosomal protein S18 acetylase RimI-like enzyme
LIRDAVVTKGDVVFRNVTAAEAAKVCKFGEAELTRTFKYLYNDEDFGRYVSEAYTPEIYEDWIKNPDYLVYGAFLDGGKENATFGASKVSGKGDEVMVAYILAGLCNLPLPKEEAKMETNGCPHGEVKRLYCHPSTFGSGIAEQLLRNSITWLRSGEGRLNRNIYLGVFSENPRAIKFYEKHNFNLCGEYQFVVGKQLDREFIMKNAGSSI